MFIEEFSRRLLYMRLIRFIGLFLLLMPFALVHSVLADDTYDDTPSVQVRVARISFISGEVQIRRSDSDDWEKAARDLPVVEGDQITTGAGARVELQLDSYNYVRLNENSLLTFNTLRDGQIALSLPEGTMSVRVLAFDKDRNSFEIDAPKTTIAIQKAGSYRLDTGDKDSQEIRVTVTQDGSARVYSDESGFNLKNGKTARIYLDGDNVGEPDINTAAVSADEWDSWVLDRDSITATKLSTAYYDKYYDRDVFGAEDLNQYGEWIYTNKYGYVWRPYSNYTSSYDNWSPYRYGSWRWVPPYGWTWQGDEPWGWSTYHYGRWISYNGSWAWTPYGSHRWHHSWWQPALVVITWSGSSICWYPLPYNYYYYDYNDYYGYSGHYWDGGHHNGDHHHNGGGNGNGGWSGGNGGNGGNGGSQNPGNGGGGPPNTLGPGLIKGPKTPPLQPTGPLDPAYTTAVTTVPSDGFGGSKALIKQAPLAIASGAIKPRTPSADPVRLPALGNVKVASDIKPTKQTDVSVRHDDIKMLDMGNSGPVGTVKVGAAVRESGVRLDDTLRKDRVFGGRPPVVEKAPDSSSGNTVKQADNPRDGTVRDTGAVKRDESPQETYTKPRRDDSVRPSGSDNSNDSVRNNNPKPRSEPTYTPRSEPKSEPRSEPRSEPKSQPRSEPKSEPRSEPKPQKSDPPPSKPSQPSTVRDDGNKKGKG
jgi:hypothetical protein